MTVDELAEELYNLVVIKGRWKGKPNTLLSDGTYKGQPDFIQSGWQAEALGFASQYTFSLED